MDEADPKEARRALVRVLQHAHAGELAACHAYRGHALSLRDADERAQVERIEGEERVHRECVGRMLASLDAGPDASRERLLRLVGQTIGLLCRVGGWYVPMYGAGRLESQNVKEYEDAADLATRCGREDLVEELLVMAEVEWDHERYFREKVLSHWLRRLLPPWKAIPPRGAIRASYAERRARALPEGRLGKGG